MNAMNYLENSTLENYPFSIEKIGQENLPDIIKSQIRELTDLEEKKNKSSENAEKAKRAAEEMKSFVKKKFLGIGYHSGDTKEIIGDMQKVIQLIAEAQESNAQATAYSFKFMQQLTKSSEYLFSLGCFNFATTEVMIKELTSCGKGLTGHEGVSDAVKEKMLEVAKRLNMQKDLMLRQNKLEEKLREKDGELRELKDKFAEMEKLQNKLEQDDRNNKGDIHQLKENASKNKTEIKAVLKKHKWLFWIMGGLLVLMMVGMVFALT